MKKLFQIISLCLTIGIFLTACSKEQRQEIKQKIVEKQVEKAIKKLPKHNEPMPEYPQIKSPSELSNEDIDKNVQYVTAQVVEKSNKIIFFSKEEQADGERDLVENKENSEYYRSILGTTQDGNCAIQDFYSENDKKQIEPMIVRKDECESWKAQPFDGMALWYDKDGKIDMKLGGGVIVWFEQGKQKRVLGEADETIFYGEEIRPDIYKKIFLTTQILENAKRAHAWECEFDEKNNKINYLILFPNDDYGVNKLRFNENNKIDTNHVIVWTEDGYGYIDTMEDDKVESVQKVALDICGVKDEQSVGNKAE